MNSSTESPMTRTAEATPLAVRIGDLDPCDKAVAWLGDKTAKTAWAECERGDWMLWLLARLCGPPESDSRKKLVQVCCDCAELSLPVFEARYPNDNRPRVILETARRYANGECALDELQAVAMVFDIDDVSVAAVADAARAAVIIAHTTNGDLADVAPYVVSVAAASGHTEAYKRDMLRICADIVRRHYPDVEAVLHD